MEKKVSEKEKLYQKAIAYVEKMMAEGQTITRAREMATVKFGISNPTMIKMTMHLSSKK
jgi:hypothetical protein